MGNCTGDSIADLLKFLPPNSWDPSQLNPKGYALVTQTTLGMRMRGAWPEPGCVPHAEDKALRGGPSFLLPLRPSVPPSPQHPRMDGHFGLSASGTYFHHMGQNKSQLGQQGNGREEPPPDVCWGVDIQEAAASLGHVTDKCLMPMTGEVHVSQSHCLCLSEKWCILSFIFW